MNTLDSIILIIAAGIGGITSGALLSNRWPHLTKELALAGYCSLAATFVVIIKNL